MNEQTKAERLADALADHTAVTLAQMAQVAAELRRLSAVNATLLEALNIIAGNRRCVDNLMGDADIARAAICVVLDEILRVRRA